ncbi:MAG: hypothetical protein GWO04_24665, partial [Actinobacteria bacterium]|nr:hypothetical protein [Actinomycetota bacterium]
MTRRHQTLIALVALLGWASPGRAQVDPTETETAPAEATETETAPAEATETDTETEPIPEPPAASEGEVEAEDDYEPPTEVVATPEPEPEESEGNDLVPPGDAELADDHPVDAADITFVPGKGLRLTSADDR